MKREGERATLRVYIFKEAKRSVVIKEDDLLTKKEIQAHAPEVTKATLQELNIWITNKCFEVCSLKDAKKT